MSQSHQAAVLLWPTVRPEPSVHRQRAHRRSPAM